LSKSDEFSIRQDALFNGITLMQMITHLSWDENSTTSNDILNTTGSPQFTCDAITHYRIGGFRGSRNCENNVSVRGTLGADGAETNTTFNDIDDFNGADINTSIYGLHISTRYIDDTFTYTPLSQNARINLNSSVAPLSTNIKYVDINITYQGQKAALKNKTISQFAFASANIGKFFLNKRAW
ncbi:MAG: hypothetical protein PHR87_11780, partial [Sulfurospirillaceae bacterium]|nr:hypothetical protein [Sulfurospirillaceae bacterium]